MSKVYTPLLRFQKGDRIVYTSVSDMAYPGTFLEFEDGFQVMRVQFDYKDRPSSIVMGTRVTYEGNPFDLEPLI